MAELIGVTTRRYQYLEGGARLPNVLSLCKVANALKVDISALFEK